MLKRLSISAAASLIVIASSAQIREYPVPFPKPIGHGTDTVSVMVIGDVMMHSRQLEYDCRHFLEGISPALRQADIAVANMEFSLAGPHTAATRHSPLRTGMPDMSRTTAEWTCS